MPITALPTPPTRSDPANFSTRADSFLSALPDFATEANALQVDVNNKQATASAAATTATNAANTATTTANAGAWSAGTNYTAGQTVYDTTDFLTYRRIIAGTTATRPGLDSTNWLLLTGWSTTVPNNTGGTPLPGRVWVITAGQTLNTGIVAGSSFSIYNNSALPVTITQGSGLTLRLSGTLIAGNRSLFARGMATVWCLSATEYIINGDIL